MLKEIIAIVVGILLVDIIKWYWHKIVKRFFSKDY